VFTDGKVETMFKLTYEQADNLARLNEGARSLAQVSGPALSSHDSIMWQTAFPGHDPRLIDGKAVIRLGVIGSAGKSWCDFVEIIKGILNWHPADAAETSFGAQFMDFFLVKPYCAQPRAAPSK
jgi:hypothetical protein